ncbi:hypothetical protein C8Q72DRAFT_139048 [Fomitopsis betulina]|nr:hypothetical protein C8Q72DRAFT_139048 [Fomitopsis betulina]
MFCALSCVCSPRVASSSPVPPLPACATSVSSICRGTSIARHALSGCPLRARSHRTSTYRSSHGSCSSSQSCVHSSVRFTPEPLATLRPETRPRPTVRVQFPSRRRARPATWSRSGVGGTALYLRDDIAPFTHSVEHRQSGTLRSSVASAVPSSVPACTRYTLIRIHCCSHTQSLDLSTQSHLTPSGPGEHHNHILFGIPVRLPRRARAAHTRAPGPNARCCLLLHRASRHYQLTSPLSSPSRYIIPRREAQFVSRRVLIARLYMTIVTSARATARTTLSDLSSCCLERQGRHAMWGNNRGPRFLHCVAGEVGRSARWKGTCRPPNEQSYEYVHRNITHCDIARCLHAAPLRQSVSKITLTAAASAHTTLFPRMTCDAAHCKASQPRATSVHRSVTGLPVGE